MAELVCERVDLFPNSTVIKAWPRMSFHQSTSMEGIPSGEKAAEATMTSGKATFTGLTAGASYILYAVVASKDTYLLMTVPAAVATNPITGIVTPANYKLLGMAFDPILAASAEAITTTAGTLHLAKVFVPEASKIANVVMWLSKKGATLTALENGLGIFSEGRVRLGFCKPSTLITAWEGTDKAVVSVALETAVNVPAGFVWVGWYYNGTTAPSFAIAPKGTNEEGIVNVGVKENESRFATGDAGLTTALPNPITSPLTAAQLPYWAGVS